MQIFVTTDHGKEVFTIESGVIALECIRKSACRNKYAVCFRRQAAGVVGGLLELVAQCSS